jgi:thiol-disulfide isomerase/thioredoxin
MLQRILLLNSFLLALLAAAPRDLPVAAQSRKPSQALRQVAEQQRKMLEAYERAAGEAKAQPQGLADPDELNEALKKIAAERASGFRIGDWAGEELYALATLYQLAEQFTPAAEAFRAFIKSGSRSKNASNAHLGLVDALIETEQIEEAEKLLARLDLTFIEQPAVMAARAGLYQDLAVALRDRASYEKAATMASKGYNLADSLALARGVPPNVREAAERNQIILAALAVASYERAGQKREANDLNELVKKFDFNRQPELRSVYEAELASARLVGTAAPELAIARWLEGRQKNLGELRGKVVLLDFWAMWCGPCVTAFPHLRAYQSKYGSKGLEIIGVTRFYGRSDTEESLARDQELKSLQSYKTAHQLTYPFAVGKMDDVTNEERYGVIGLPTVVLIDRRGHVRHVKRGGGEYRKLEKLIEKLVGEK